MRHRFHLRLQSLILLALVPTILVVTALYGYSNYSAVYNDILGGFDRKLLAVGTSAASFIDGDDHERLIRPRAIFGVAFDSERGELVGVDRSYGYLVRLDRATGSAEELTKVSDASLAGSVASLTFDSKRGSFYGVLDGGAIVLIGRDGKIEVLPEAKDGWTALAYSAKDDLLYLTGASFAAYSPETKKLKLLGEGPAPKITGLISTDEGFTAVLGEHGGVIRFDTTRIPIDVGAMIVEKNPEAETEAESAGAAESEVWVEPEVVTLPAHGIAFDGEKLFTVTDRLLALSRETGEADPTGYRMGFRSDSSALYRKYAAPMKRTMDEVGLTYHYTIILPKENQVIYALDATDGENHSNAGTEEDVEADEWRRLEAVRVSGIPSQSDIKKFDIWGLLKVGTTPIRNSKGDIVALSGQDVDISVIQQKTRVAMLEVLLVGGLSLILATMASFGIARRLISPIQRLKEGALQVAAGRFERAIEVKRPRELKELSQSFDEIRRALKNRIATLEEENAKFEGRRRRHELMKLLSRGPRSEREPSGSLLVEFFGPGSEPQGASGWVQSDEKLLVWLARSPSDELKTQLLRGDISNLCGKLLHTYANDWTALRERLEAVFRDEVHLFVLIDPRGKRFYSLARQPAHATVLSNDAEGRPCELGKYSEHPLAPIVRFTFEGSEHGAHVRPKPEEFARQGGV